MAKDLNLPVSSTGGTVDRFNADKAVAYDLEPNTPLAFPPAADFAHGGSFLVYVPAGANVVYRPRPSSAGFPLAPGYWPWVFRRAEIAQLEADGEITIVAIRNEEN